MFAALDSIKELSNIIHIHSFYLLFLYTRRNSGICWVDFNIAQ